MPDALSEYEGSVPPSFFHNRAPDRTRDFMSKLPVRVGRVTKVYQPIDPGSRSKLFVEYDVLVDDGSEDRPSTRFTIPHCVVTSAFGGAADFSSWTPRPIEGDKLATDPGNESKVLVLLVSASFFGGVIIGGAQHRGRGADDSTAGINGTTRFNGLDVHVADDGSLSITFNGATNSDGSARATNTPGAGGAKVQMKADGSITAETALAAQRLRLDQTGKTAELGSFTQTTVQADAGPVLVQPSSVGPFKVGLGTDAMVKGTTYRVAEAASNFSVAAAATAASAAWGALAALMVTPGMIAMAAADPSGATGTALTTVAGAALTASAAMATAATAISTFEGGAPAYLSPRSSTD